VTLTLSRSRARGGLQQAWQGLRLWRRRQLAVAVAAGLAFAVLIGVATVLIPNPLFARDIAPVWWNYPVWIITSALSGMLIATYVAPGTPADGSARAPAAGERASRRDGRFGLAGGILAWFAVGCPVCNKIALIALGYSGAITWFAPVQPFLAVGALIFTTVALLRRLQGQVACDVRPARTASA